MIYVLCVCPHLLPPHRNTIQAWEARWSACREASKNEKSTLPETDMAPENQWLEDEFPFGKAYFQGLC